MTIKLLIFAGLVLISVLVAEATFRLVWPRKWRGLSSLLVRSILRSLLISPALFDEGFRGVIVPFALGLIWGLDGWVLQVSTAIWGVVVITLLAAEFRQRHHGGFAACALPHDVGSVKPSAAKGYPFSTPVVVAVLVALPFAVVLASGAVNGARDRRVGGSFGSSVSAMDNDPSDTVVNEVFLDGTWLGDATGGGGIVMSGISLPQTWRPGLTATVKWQRCNRAAQNQNVSEDHACRWTEKVVAIHPYVHVGATWLHILPGEQVLIIPSMLGPGHPDYPGPDFPVKNHFRLDNRE